MKRFATAVLVLATLAGCSHFTTNHPSASVYSNRQTCEAAGGGWNDVSNTCTAPAPTARARSSYPIGPSGTPGERPPGAS